jgi:hypothetical protein
MKNKPMPALFTKELGIRVQTEQLNAWKSVLLPHLSNKLQVLATKDNDSAVSGYDILRGTEIDNLVHNELMKRD